MCETEIGKCYRDTVSGVVGTARGKGADPAARPHGAGPGAPLQSVATTQLDLRPEHLCGEGPEGHPQGHQLRWYDDLRLEPVGEA